MQLKKNDIKVGLDFQTPYPVAKYMVSLLPDNVMTVCEPTPGPKRHIVKALIHRGGV